MPEPSRAPQSLGQLIHLFDLSGFDLLYDHLGDSVMGPMLRINVLNYEVFGAVVEENNTDFASVVLVDNSGAHIDGVLPGQP